MRAGAVYINGIITYDLCSAYPYSLTKGTDMATKEQGGSSCYEKAAPDEPVFTLRAQDSLAPEIVREWAFRAQVAGTPADKVAEARKVADDMEQWQIANLKKVSD